MGRWTQYDEDDYRLPEGMKRVGYDADTGKYYFRDQDGSLWEGPEGAQYGEMKRVSDAPIALGDHDGNEGEDEEMAVGPSRPDGYQPLAVDSEGTTRSGHILNNTTAYRVILPFFVIVAVALLLAIRLVYSPTVSTDPPEAAVCPGTSQVYSVKAGDTCWDLSQSHGCTLQDILDVNPGLQCSELKPGQPICLPSLEAVA